MSNPTSAGPSGRFSRRGILGGGVTVLAAGALSACKSSTSSAEAGSGSGGAQKGKKVIFVVHEKNSFFPPVQKGFEAYGKAMGWQTQFTGPATFDQSTVVNMMQNAVNAKPDGLILTRIDDTSYDGVIKAAQAAGIPVILSNVASADYEKLGVGFVGQDFVPAGVTAGEQILKHIAKQGRRSGAIVIGKIQAGNSALEQRGKGIKQAVSDYNRAHGTKFTTEDLIVGTDEAGAVSKIDGRYSRDPHSVAGWAGTAFECQFVATWAKSKNLVGKFANGGFDMTSPVLAGIKDGSIDYTIGQNPWAQGWVAAALLAQQIDPGYPSFTYDTGAEVVDSSNIAAVSAREAKVA
ncbi:substrate-binding domain-containing protein [Streptomyces sp. NBC_00873]|uniref:substrate-binding domain-containing protein n=1 Tax=Streptomyces sp. NBC_00873 TaxID=2975852 RepID=UPI003863B586|nr:substrate-binding domain-containing protein [Streptomyces sp. NBC_00873]